MTNSYSSNSTLVGTPTSDKSSNFGCAPTSRTPTPTITLDDLLLNTKIQCIFGRVLYFFHERPDINEEKLPYGYELIVAPDTSNPLLFKRSFLLLGEPILSVSAYSQHKLLVFDRLHYHVLVLNDTFKIPRLIRVFSTVGKYPDAELTSHGSTLRIDHRQVTEDFASLEKSNTDTIGKGVSGMRRLSGKDCFLVCEDSSTIEAHSLVLANNWPYFRDNHYRDMVASRSGIGYISVNLPYSRACVEALVSHFYEEPGGFTFEQAAGLVELCRQFDIYDLHVICVRHISQSLPTLSQSLAAWRLFNGYDNDELRRWCACRVHMGMKIAGNPTNLISQLSQSELVRLISDFALIDG